ncbi:hypothetical protein BaRGS_00018339 [Batillaria attramentaria]|uniref:Tetraspanin n=1 Tax=Batillaria attramentaria TaxID=370345 RepID=A0ABD0KU47_9CAEN
MPFNLCLGRNRPGNAAQRILPPEVIEELSKVRVPVMVVGIVWFKALRWAYGVQPLKRQRSTRSTRSTASRRRQNEDTCTTCLRATLHCYNVCILIIGCAALGVGVWLLVTDFGARNVTPLVDSQMYEVTTYLLISGGGAVALLAFCGCCGTIREDKCVLSFYGTTLAIVLINLGVACGLAFIFRGTEDNRVMGRYAKTVAMLRHSGQYHITRVVAFLFLRDRVEPQAEFDCCAKGDVQLCTGLKSFNGPPLFFDSHLPKYREINPYLYTTGCYDKLIEYLYTYSAVVGCVAAVVPLFLVLGIVVSFCLCARVAGISSDEEVEL